MVPTVPTGRGSETVEVPPTHCRNGHRLVPGNVLVGWSPMTWVRTYLCRTCGSQLRVSRDGSVAVVQQQPEGGRE